MSHLHPETAVYIGTKRKLVLAFDIGTTYSGISYSILDPGQVPEIRGVMRFPAHEHISGASKIPTMLYYNGQGVMVAAGAEATKEGIYETATDEGWAKAEWFKLHVRSNGGTATHYHDMLPPLPPNKTVVQILGDFMRYLSLCAKEYIQDTHANGRDLWDSVERDIDYVITHPNGWEGYQQSQLRDAAILAGVIPDSEDGKARITFLTEGEASLHYAIRNGLPTGALTNGEGVIIVDSGGGTVDVCSYRKASEDRKARFEEIAVPQCHLLGSIFVSINAKIFLSELLKESNFYEDLDYIVKRFDSTTKLRFRSDTEPQFIRFGGNRDNDETYGIRYGQLKLPGTDVATFFAPSIKCITQAVLDQVRSAHNPISHVILVGGFSSNDWLFSKVDNELREKGLSVVRPENYVNKAVSDGAISFYLSRQVRSRVSKFAYGTLRAVNYDPSNPEHVKREQHAYFANDGMKTLNDNFKTMIPKNAKIKEKAEYRWRSVKAVPDLSPQRLKKVRTNIWCYRGNHSNPMWEDEDPAKYTRLCQLVADLRSVPHETRYRPDNGSEYYRIKYEYVLFYEGVELKAQMAWREDGVEKRSRAYVVYDPTE